MLHLKSSVPAELRQSTPGKKCRKLTFQSRDFTSFCTTSFFFPRPLFCNMSSFAPPTKKARRSHSNGSSADTEEDFFPGFVQMRAGIFVTGFSSVIKRVWYILSLNVYFLLLGINKIEYKPDGGPGDNLCFKHYNPQEVNMLFKS